MGLKAIRVRFLENVLIQNKINISKGEIFQADETEEFIYIRMKDDSTVKAPKDEIEGVLEIIAE